MNRKYRPKVVMIADGKNLEINLTKSQIALVLNAQLWDHNNNEIAQSDYTYVDSGMPTFTDSHCNASANFALILENKATNRILCTRSAA